MKTNINFFKIDKLIDNVYILFKNINREFSSIFNEVRDTRHKKSSNFLITLDSYIGYNISLYLEDEDTIKIVLSKITHVNNYEIYTIKQPTLGGDQTYYTYNISTTYSGYSYNTNDNCYNKIRIDEVVTVLDAIDIKNLDMPKIKEKLMFIVAQYIINDGKFI